MTVRQRLIPALCGFVVFTLLGTRVHGGFWQQWWFYVGLGMTLGVLFIEPYYTRAQDAIANAAAGVGAWAAADKASIESLWLCFLIFAIVILVLGVLAAVLPASARDSVVLAKIAANHTSARLGRAVVVGGTALALEVVSLAHDHKNGYVQLALGTAALIATLTPNWSRIFRAASTKRQLASALSATGPSLLLVATDGGYTVGSALEVEGSLGTATGWVVASLPGESGPLHEITLDRPVGDVIRNFPEPIGLQAVTTSVGVVGSVGPGTTDLRLVFNPTAELRVGDPLKVGRAPGDERVFQVTELELRRETWRGTTAVVALATAAQVGTPKDGWVRMHPLLPRPHEFVYRSNDLRQQLPEGFHRVGVMKGTEVEIGVDVAAPDTGHFAVLGISGMGKTSVAMAICRALSLNSCVIALDTTGEYRTRLDVSPDVPDDFDAPGFWVHEPRGEPTEAARTYIEKVMTVANGEYTAGDTPSRRVLVLAGLCLTLRAT